MSGGATRNRPLFVIAGVFAVSVIGAAAYVALKPAGQVAVRTPTASVLVPAARAVPAPTCRLVAGESVAFQVESTLSAAGIEDRFDATMSWEVVQSTAGSARVRAAFSQVTLTQKLARPGEETPSPEGVAFYLDIAEDCSVRNTAFAPEWDARTRMLVQTQIDNNAFALPATQASTWGGSGRDGIGDYTARYRATSMTPWTIERSKLAHKPRTKGASLGVDLRVEGAQAVATFDPADPRWWATVRGQESVVIDAEGSPVVTLRQRFSMTRDDARFEPVPTLDLARADRTDPRTMALPNVEPTTPHAHYAAAWQAFAQHLADGRDHDAALVLAAWLKAHPEDVDRLVSRLRENQNPSQHAALFLALELSGTPEARDGLMGLIDAAELSGLDQARAASALADLGAPTLPVAERLLKRAEADDMAARVSLLGAGSMMSRSQDEALRQGVFTALSERLDTAGSEMVNTVIDAMGNSGDAAFEEAIGDALGAESKITRRHAANAMARLPAETAAPHLLEQLEAEQSPRVAAALINALESTGQRPPEAMEVMASLLEAASAEERSAAIDWIGKGHEEAAQELLVAQFHREPSARLKQQIGRYVPATALR